MVIILKYGEKKIENRTFLNVSQLIQRFEYFIEVWEKSILIPEKQLVHQENTLW